jgi:hypothetical protein
MPSSAVQFLTASWSSSVVPISEPRFRSVVRGSVPASSSEVQLFERPFSSVVHVWEPLSSSVLPFSVPPFSTVGATESPIRYWPPIHEGAKRPSNSALRLRPAEQIPLSRSLLRNAHGSEPVGGRDANRPADDRQRRLASMSVQTSGPAETAVKPEGGMRSRLTLARMEPATEIRVINPAFVRNCTRQVEEIAAETEGRSLGRVDAPAMHLDRCWPGFSATRGQIDPQPLRDGGW